MKRLTRLAMLAMLLPTLSIHGCGDDGDNGSDGDGDGTGDDGADDGGDDGGDGTGDDGGDGTGDDGGTGDGGSGDCDPDAPLESVSGTIEADTTWDCSKRWVLEDLVVVKGGSTLTVEAGTTVLGRNGSALVITRDSQLMSQGTADAPVVFTSSQAEGSRARGDWGGIVLNGRATINLDGGLGQSEGIEGEDGVYGGGDSPDDAYSCGMLEYTRVEFAGFELTMDNELNGITFNACGTGTKVSYVQSHMGLDDGIEMFGGKFDADHVVVSGAADDSVDCDQGYTGTLDHVFIFQDPALGNYGLEWSNQDTNLDATPRTNPTLTNATIIGTGGDNDTKSAGVRLKEGVAATISNTIITNMYNHAVELTEDATETQANDGNITFENDLFFDNSKVDDGATTWGVGDMSMFDLEGLMMGGSGNLFDMDPQLGSIEWGSPDPLPASGSPALDAGGSYIGAFNDEDWTAGWTNFSPS